MLLFTQNFLKASGWPENQPLARPEMNGRVYSASVIFSTRIFPSCFMPSTVTLM